MSGKLRSTIAARLTMKTGDLVLDTSAVVEHFKGNRSVSNSIENAGVAYLPVTALGELQYGALNSGNPSKKTAQIEKFLESVELLRPDKGTSTAYAEVRLRLAREGNPIPENDLWIAAHAKQMGVPLMTKDKHFDKISDLAVFPVEFASS